MSELAKNTFEGGIQQDLDSSLAKSNTLLYGENIKIVNSDNTNYIITNIKGTELKGQLKPNYWVKGVEVSNDIAYIVSAEVVNGVATGRGEIGCFPSPNYSTGDITWDYRAFRNYKGDNDQNPNFDGELNSQLFNFSTESRVKLEIQQDYDGSVNVVITDNENPIRIINSGFSKLPNYKYSIINRTGNKETNKYDNNSWDSTMNLILKPSTIAQVEFISLTTDGSLKSGNITFYFKYANDESNATNVFAQTQPIAVFKGTTFAGADISQNIEGNVATTNKAINLKLTNLDTSYSLLVIYYALETNSGTQYFKLSQNKNLTSSTMEVKITGLENTTDVAVEEVDADLTTFDTAKDMTQIQNRLIIANVKGVSYDHTLLRKFAAYIIPKFKEVPIHCGHNENTQSMGEFGNPYVQETKSGFGDGRSWNNGYSNPKNIYHRKGYWGGETYPFGIFYIMKNYSTSPVFPTYGYDDKDSTVSVTLNDIKATVDTLLEGNNDGYDTITTGNINGVYRFPTRNSSGSNSLATGTGVNTFGVKFTLPPLDTDLDGNGTTISDLVIGIGFVRGGRVKDCLLQGVALSCYPFHASSPSDDFSDVYIWNGPDRDPMTKVMPLIKGLIPTRQYQGKDELSGCGPYPKGNTKFEGELPEIDVVLHYGQTVSKLHSTGGKIVDSVNISNYAALYSPDIDLNQSELYGFLNNANSSLYFQKLGRQVAAACVGDYFNTPIFISFPIDDHTFNGVPQLVKALYTTKQTASPQAATTTYICDQNITDIDRFTSSIPKERFQALVIDGSSYNVIGDGSRFPVSHSIRVHTYLGIKGANLLDDIYGYNSYQRDYDKSGGGPLITAGLEACDVRQVEFHTSPQYRLTDSNDINLITKGAAEYWNFFNVYKNNGLASWDAIKASYNPVSIRYTPISQRLYLYSGIKEEAKYEASVITEETSYTEAYYEGGFDRRNSLNTVDGTLIKTPMFWGGDCHITPWCVKQLMTSDALRGIYFTAFVESDYNGYLYGSSSNFPFNIAKLREGNDWMNQSYNSGFKQTISKKQYTSPDRNAPFVKAEFDTRVYYSDIHVQNSFKNAYRSFGLLNYKDYSKHLGEITRIINIKNTLFMVQERGISVIPFNERVETSRDSAGEIYVGQSDVLSQYVGSYSERFGTKFQFACVPTNDNLYVLDLNNFKIICLTPQRGIEYVSDLKVESHFRKYLSSFINAKEDITSLGVLGHDHTITHKEILWTFYDKNSTDKFKNISLAYNVQLRQFTSFHNMIPYQSFSIEGNQYVTNFKAEQNKIHSIETNPVRNLIFDEAQKSIIRFRVNDKYDFEKVFDNISIISNHVLPDSVIYYVDGGNTEQNITYDPANIHLSNAKHREGVTYITIPRIENITNLDATEFLNALYDNASSQLNTVTNLGDKSRFKGKVLVIELQFETDKQLRLNSVISQYRISNS